LPELQRGELVPLVPQCPVVEFPGYWFVCPPRHLNRRIVRLFSDWITEEASQHEQETRAVLAGMGCRFEAAQVVSGMIEMDIDA
jgi:hypothetical protein